MPYYDLELDALRTYRTSSRPPADLDGSWARALADARGGAVPATLTPHRPDVYGALAVDDVVFSGADGDPIPARGSCARARRRAGSRAASIYIRATAAAAACPSTTRSGRPPATRCS